MRQKLNENPVAQAALIAVLALVGGYLLLSSMSGGEKSSGGEAVTPASSVSTEPSTSGETATSSESATGAATSVAVPTGSPLPAAVEHAYARGATVVLLVVGDGGIDDRLVERAASAVRGDSGVSLFVVPAKDIARYAPITGPLGVEGAPALIVVRPRRLNGGGPAPATVTYGFQSPSDVEQAIRDTLYKGSELSYAPN